MLSLFNDSMGVDNLIFGFFVFSKSSLYIWKFSVHVLLKPGLENFDYFFASVWDDCNCAIVWTSFGIAFFLSHLFIVNYFNKQYIIFNKQYIIITGVLLCDL